MLTLYVLQSVVPLALVAWLAVTPPRSTIGFWTQAIATALGLNAVGTTGLWLFPPWWTPVAHGVLLSAVVIAGLATRRHFWPAGVAGWLTMVGFALLSLYAANVVRVALAVTSMPEGRSVDLASPLGPGTYLVANGGAGPSINAHAAWLDQSVAKHKPWWGTGHAVDLIAIDGWGLRANGLMPSEPSRYRIFGKPVVAPCAGEIVVALDGLPDMPVPETDTGHLAGNHVILRCAGVDILLAHFRKGSVAVRNGQQLATGDAIAAVGNSGNSSEPHLHIHAQRPGTTEAPFSGAPLPIRINGRYLVRNNRFVVPGQGVQP